MNELVVRLSCAAPGPVCDDTNGGALVGVDPLMGAVQIGALIVVALLVFFVVRARRQR